MELLIFTGQRRGEIGALKWQWIDAKNRTITLPSSVTKNKRERTRLYGQAFADRLETIGRKGQFPFPGNRGEELPFSGWSSSGLLGCCKPELHPMIDQWLPPATQRSGTSSANTSDG